MATDFLTLLRRDHADLQGELARLLDPLAGVSELRAALDGVRLGLMSHIEAEDLVLGRFDAVPALHAVIVRLRAEHRVQEVALGALVIAPPRSFAWRNRVVHLRELVRRHAVHELRVLQPALQAHASAEAYMRLASAFATERLRQLASLQPSAPIRVPLVGAR